VFRFVAVYRRIITRYAETVQISLGETLTDLIAVLVTAMGSHVRPVT
jgi:hypothetical protein